MRDTKYDHLFEAYSRANLAEYDWLWTKAQAYQESRFDPVAVSPVGARGLMQIMPGTAREMARRTGVEGPLTSPTINVMYGTAYMRRMLDFWTAPRPPQARLELAQASYNAGAGHILKAQNLSGGHALWCGISPHLVKVTGRHSEETITYVHRIKRWYGDLHINTDGA